jgi:hypothetical protein
MIGMRTELAGPSGGDPMRSSDEWWMYLGTGVVFAGIVLWGANVEAAMALGVAALGVVIVILALLRARATSKILVVGPRRTEAVDLVDQAVDDAGYEVVSCDGPRVRPCPLDAQRTCPVHASISGVVIVRDPGASGPPPGCGEALAAPAVCVEATPEGVRRLRTALRV